MRAAAHRLVWRATCVEREALPPCVGMSHMNEHHQTDTNSPREREGGGEGREGGLWGRGEGLEVVLR